MRIGLLSDAHGNVAGFERGLEVLESAGVDEIWFLGDAIGYLPDTGVLALIRERDINMIRGNHEDMLLRGGCPAEKEPVHRLREIEERLDENAMHFLAALPDQVRLTWGARQCLLVHGSPDQPVRGYVYPDTGLEPFLDVAADVIFMGNTHYPFVRRQAGKLFVNVGSCGLPRDASGLGRVAVYDAAAEEAEIIGYSLSDAARKVLAGVRVHEAVAAKLRACIGKEP